MGLHRKSPRQHNPWIELGKCRAVAAGCGHGAKDRVGHRKFSPEESAPFRRVEDLLAIKGGSKGKLEELRPYGTVVAP